MSVCFGLLWAASRQWTTMPIADAMSCSQTKIVMGVLGVLRFAFVQKAAAVHHCQQMLSRSCNASEELEYFIEVRNTSST
jgi:hypothetical protein